MAWLDAELTTIALCWRIERRDGIAAGLTGHDHDLLIDGLMHRASPGMTPSSIQRGDTLEPADMQVTGAFDARTITERDLLAGRWDGARVRVFAADWTDPSRQVALAEGRIGSVAVEDGAFTAELVGAGVALAAAVAEETSPGCRAELGDKRCRVAMAGRTALARVVRQDGARVVLDVAEPVANGWGNGRLRWLGGANCGLSELVRHSEGAAVTLARVPRLAVTAGDRVELREGCDKRIATCAGRFGNAANFRGEPFLPGIDLLTRYPGA